MVDAADFNPPTSSTDSQSVLQDSSMGRRRRAIGLGLLVVAIGLLAYLLGTKHYQSNGLFASFFQPQFEDPDYVVIQTGVIPRPHEVNTFTNAIIPPNQIEFAGTSLDEVASLTDPPFLPSGDGKHMFPNDRVIGVKVGEVAKAYPLKIISYHEAINDHFGDRPVLVTYCCLCDSAAAFDRSINGEAIEFGISGLLFNSNILLYSRTKNKSLWSQMQCQAVTGPHSGTRLQTIPLEVTTWSDWCRRHPDTGVLSKETKYQSSYFYRRNAAEDYLKTDKVLHPVAFSNNRLPRKARVFAVWTDKAARAYPLSAFESWQKPGELKQTLDGRQFTLSYDPATKSLRIAEGGEQIQQLYSLWFAWHAFHPEAEVYEPRANESVLLQ